MFPEDYRDGESVAEREARLQATWDAMSKEDRAAWVRRVDLKLFATWQRDADLKLARLAGRDQPLYHGGPGREREVVTDSAISFYRGFKEQAVSLANKVRNGESLF